MWHRLYFDITFAHCFYFSCKQFESEKQHEVLGMFGRNKEIQMHTMWTVLVSVFFLISCVFEWKTAILECFSHCRLFLLCDFSCSFDCFKKHKNADCTPAQTESQDKCGEAKARKPILQFTTEDTVDPEKLAQLGMVDCIEYCLLNEKNWRLDFHLYLVLIGESEPLRDLLRNPHLRDFIRAVDSSANAHRAMKHAMMEPLFVEFADECMKIVEPETPKDN